MDVRKMGLGLVLTGVISITSCTNQNLQNKVDVLQKENEAIKTENMSLRTELELYKQQLQAKPTVPPDVIEQPARPSPTEKVKPIGKGKTEGLVLETIFFNSGSPKLTSSMKKTLDKVVKKIKKDYPEAHIEVAGHSDNTPPKKVHKSNQELSEERAELVAKYLIGHGISKEKISVIGYGDTKPLDSKKLSKNRRVEIVITK